MTATTAAPVIGRWTREPAAEITAALTAQRTVANSSRSMSLNACQASGAVSKPIAFAGISAAVWCSNQTANMRPNSVSPAIAESNSPGFSRSKSNLTVYLGTSEKVPEPASSCMPR